MDTIECSIWLVPCKYNTDGWRLEFIDHKNQSYALRNNEEEETAILIKVLHVEVPPLEERVRVGHLYVEKMRTELLDSTAEATSQIKDYEARLLCLTND